MSDSSTPEKPAPSEKKSIESTRERILQAAERIYAASGFHGMSLRDVTLLAGVNLAAVNYHFGSKDKLILALADRRLTPINTERLARLEKLRKKHEDTPIPIADLIGALVSPVLEALQQGKSTRAIMVRLAGQLMTDEPQRFAHLHRIFYKETLDQFCIELERSLPHLTPHQIHARFFCVFCTVLGMRLMHESMALFLHVRTESRQIELLETELPAFILGAFNAHA